MTTNAILHRTRAAILFVGALLVSATAIAGGIWLSAISDETGPAFCPPGFAIVKVICTGSYCDNVRPLCDRFAVPGAPRDGAQYWTDWFSEESGPNTDSFDGSTWPRLKKLSAIAVAIQCRGDYCDDMRLLMELIQPAARHSGGMSMDSKAESPYCATSSFTVSDETTTPIPTAPLTFLRRVGCSGRYCDNLRFETCTLHRAR